MHRIIPARAGQTVPVRYSFAGTTDHPRACGANRGRGVFASCASGSSPRVRGKRRGAGHRYDVARIIPARAGQTAPNPIGRGHGSDHPRACGANFLDRWTTFFLFGSSPRVRGKPIARLPAAGRPRIIPARAGQTGVTGVPPVTVPDHPRACGANLGDETQITDTTGSSPRVRGKRRHARSGTIERRIIPARAGQTSPVSPHCRRSSDHPRACGANTVEATNSNDTDGSSPRVRGKRVEVRRSQPYTRIIPARAGQTAHCYVYP